MLFPEVDAYLQYKLVTILNNLFDQKKQNKESSLQLTLDVAPTDRFSLLLPKENGHHFDVLPPKSKCL